MKGIELQCLLNFRNSLEASVSGPDMVDALFEMDCLNGRNKRQIVQGTVDSTEQVRRLIDMLVDKGQPEHLMQFMKALRLLGHDREYWLLDGFLRQKAGDERRPAPAAAAARAPPRHGGPAQPDDSTAKRILSIVDEIRTTQKEDHEQLSQLMAMRREVDAVSEEMVSLKEELEDVRQKGEARSRKVREELGAVRNHVDRVQMRVEERMDRMEAEMKTLRARRGSSGGTPGPSPARCLPKPRVLPPIGGEQKKMTRPKPKARGR